MTRIALVFLLGAALAPCAAADEPFVTKTYEVGAIIEPAAEPPTGHIGLPIPLVSPAITEWDREGSRYLSEEALEQWLQAQIRPELWASSEFASIEMAGNRMFVTAPESAHEEIAAFLLQRWNEASTRVRVDVDWVHLDAKARAQVAELVSEARRGGIPSERAATLLIEATRAGARVSSASAECRPNVHAAVRQTRRTSYVGDFNVEIAQEAVIGDPMVDVAIDGWSLDLRPFVLHDGAVAMETLFQQGDLSTPMRDLPLETPPVGTVDLPRMDVRRVATTTRLRADEARAWVFDDDGGTSIVLLRARRGVRPAAGPAVLRAIDIGALLVVPSTFAIRLDHDTGVPFPHPIVMRTAPMDAPRADQVEDLLVAQLRGDGNEADAQVVEALLLTDGTPGTAGKANAWVRSLEESLFQRKRLEVALVRRTESERVRIARTALDLTFGRSCCAQSGTEHAYVADWDVEVAQDARIGDPVTAVLFEGWVVNARADAVPGGKHVMLTFDVEFTDAVTPFEVRRPKNEATGPIELPKIKRAKIARELTLTLGVTKSIDVGSVAGDGPPTRLELEVTIGD